MKTYIYIFLFFLSIHSPAQESIEAKNFLADFFKPRTEKFNYSENRFHDFDDIKSSLDYATVVHKQQMKDFSKILLDSLSFSKTELEFVFNEMKKSNDKLWARNLIDNGKYISRKQVDEIFNDKSKGWNYFHEKYGEDLFSLSKPIFLKDNTVCFIYSEHTCGFMCASGSFDIYIKQNDEWIFFNSLRFWIA